MKKTIRCIIASMMVMSCLNVSAQSNASTDSPYIQPLTEEQDLQINCILQIISGDTENYDVHDDEEEDAGGAL